MPVCWIINGYCGEKLHVNHFWESKGWGGILLLTVNRGSLGTKVIGTKTTLKILLSNTFTVGILCLLYRHNMIKFNR